MEFMDRIENRVALPGDSETRRSQKTLTVIVIYMGAFFTLLNIINFWIIGIPGPIYFLAFLLAATLIGGTVTLIYPPTWMPVLVFLILAVVFVTMGTTVVVGGYQAGMELSIWLVQVPIAAALLIGLRFTVFSFIVYILAVLIIAFLEPYALTIAPDIPLSTRMIIASGNMIMLGALIALSVIYLIRQVERYRKRADDLLLNLLPSPIAARLKVKRQTIADNYSAVTVLFADMVGSTPLIAGLDPVEAVDWLNEAFSLFDSLVRKHGLEKIRTIGDNYMVASGVPLPREDHAQAMANFALDMVQGIEKIPARQGTKMQFRIGMHSGPLVAGVIGQERYQYDLWGDTVNIASRMESQGEAGRVQISKTTYELIKNDFECESRGTILVKGKGEMETWFLEAPRN